MTREVPGEKSRLTDRLTRLARVVAELVVARDLAAVTDIVVAHLADAAGATVSSLSLLVDEERLVLMGIRGGQESSASRWATYPVADATPAGEAVRTGEAVVVIGREEFERRYPGVGLASPGERSLVCLPLHAGARVVGAASLSFDGLRDFDDAELEFFRIMADSTAQAISRIHATEALAEQANRMEFLAQASAELAGSLDYQSTLGNITRLAVPRFADWSSVALEEDGELRTLAVAHSDPAKVALALEYQRRFPPDPEAANGSYAVLRTGQSNLIPEITPELIEASVTDPEALALVRELNLRSSLVVPLTARGRTFGTMTWVYSDSGRRFGPDDITFGEDLGRRAAVAIDNAQAHSELSEFVDELQVVVNPPELEAPPGWELAAFYDSAGRTHVGGDFYDVVPAADGKLALVIGDVMGRGVQAAAAMTQVRAAVRTLVTVDPSPSSVLRRLDLLYERFPSNQLVTLCLVLADPANDTLSVAVAGHPPPVLVSLDGGAEYLSSVGGLVLGAGGAERTETVLPYRPGETILMYTDGLVERRTEDLETSLRRLLAATSELTEPPLPAALIRLAEVVRDPTRDDDVAILAARRIWTIPLPEGAVE